jgi:putative PIN family toxin of toxin-antitoxin system
VSEAIDATTVVTACRDPKDSKLLSVAVDGGTDVIVSGEQDRLALHPFKGTAIISPRFF